MASEKPSVTIPEDDLAPLKRITELDDSQFSSLISALGVAKPSLSRQKFAEAISETVRSIRPDDVVSILRVVFILYMMKDGAEISSDEIADAVTDSAAHSATKEIQFPEETKAILRTRLKRLLGFDKSLAVTAKALDVLTEHERVFCEARILSDIRPVFAETPESASAAAIIHNLQIRFHDSSLQEHQEFYVALDTSDIQKLKAVIERAEKKTAALQSMLDRAGVAYLKA